jgi:uncharacterized membrane protein
MPSLVCLLLAYYPALWALLNLMLRLASFILYALLMYQLLLVLYMLV